MVFAICCLTLMVGCSTESKEAADVPAGSWTKGETTTKNAPETGEFKVAFETTAGNFTMLVHRDWAPHGAERFFQLIKNKYYDGAPFYRVVPGFMVQFGMNPDPRGTRYWDRPFPDDIVKQKNLIGLVSYAKPNLPNRRSTQLFINYADNSAMLDKQGFSPFAEVIEGMNNVIAINSEYGEKPSQQLMAALGNKYVFAEFPNIDYIIKATLVEDESSKGPTVPSGD